MPPAVKPAPKAAPKVTNVRVIATKLGWYGEQRRKPGSEFVYAQKDGTKLPQWVMPKAEYVKQQEAEAEAPFASADESSPL